MKKRLQFWLSFLILNVLFSVLSLSGQPALVHLSLGSKSFFNSSPSINVVWCSGEPEAEQYVLYGTTPDVTGKIKASLKKIDDKAVFTGRLKDLKYGAKYYYRCGSDIAGWSQVYSFETEPSMDRDGSFRVGVFGDTQNNSNNEELQKTKIITGLLQNYSPAFLLHMGDIVENGSVRNNWEKFLAAAEPLIAVSPLMPVLGNHDVNNKQGDDFQNPFQDFYDLFELPGNEINYSFTYGNVRFIGIFSGSAEAAAKTGQVKFAEGSKEYKWLDKELTKAEKNKKIIWTIVYMHYPVHSFGWSNIAQWKESLSPLLMRHDVDLCLAGHRHVYERHYVTKRPGAEQVKESVAFQSEEGTLFITNGSAGGNPTGTGGKDIPTMIFTPDRQMYNFAILDVNPGSLTYRVFDQENKLIDRFVIKK